jgi:ABC transporter substrate binding protein
LAAELAALKPDVLIAGFTATVGPLVQATRTVPIGFIGVADPVGAGLVDSLARPGGNATGFMQFEYGLTAKWMELLKEIAPRVTRVAVLRNPAVTLEEASAHSVSPLRRDVAEEDGCSRGLGLHLQPGSGETLERRPALTVYDFVIVDRDLRRASGISREGDRDGPPVIATAALIAWEWLQRERDFFATFDVAHYRPKEHRRHSPCYRQDHRWWRPLCSRVVEARVVARR